MMKQAIKRVAPISIKPHLPPNVALRRVTSSSGKGVYASSDTLFKGAIFGRDSIEVAEDLFGLKPRLVKRIIMTLAQLQGEIVDPVSEEEPGKIVHEYRSIRVDGKRLKGVSLHIFEELSAKWGGNDEEMIYFGSVDATPHFIRLVAAYCQKYGTKLLTQKVALRSGHVLSMRLILENAVDWLEKQQDKSPLGLIEYHRVNPHGILNQVWKDSNEFYVHENGLNANHARPIASIEVQGLAYDALIGASELIDPRAEVLKERAKRLRDTVLDKLWLPKKQYFALGFDYDPKGKPRVITTPTANPAALLDTRFFDDLPETKQQKYLSGVIDTIMSPDFLTDAGIRSRAKSASHLVPFWDYHGSYTTWPKETYDIAKGLRRQGFRRLARELENRLLNVVLKNKEYPEFVYVDEWGRVLATSPSAHGHGEVVLVDSTNNPERVQAWTVSAIMAIVANRLVAKVKPIIRKSIAQPWRKELENHILTYIPRVDRLFNPFALSARYPTYKYQLNSANSEKSGNFLHKLTDAKD